MRTCLRLPLVLLVMAVCPMARTALAQQETATMTGTVRDPAGAAVAGATVTATNVRTNVKAKTTTGGDGVYTIPSLRPGEYSVTAEFSGFPNSVPTGVILQISQVAQIYLALQTGTLTEAVEVVGATPLLDRQTSSRGLVIDQQKIVELPLNGRDYNQLAWLAPAVLSGAPRLGRGGLRGARD